MMTINKNKERFLYLVDRYNILYKEFIIMVIDHPDFPENIAYSPDNLQAIDNSILDYAFGFGDINLDSLESMIVYYEDYIVKFKQGV